jgi:hypothetical protein
MVVDINEWPLVESSKSCTVEAAAFEHHHRVKSIGHVVGDFYGSQIRKECVKVWGRVTVDDPNLLS